jgi:SAM-dependent methyltransferase
MVATSTSTSTPASASASTPTADNAPASSAGDAPFFEEVRCYGCGALASSSVPFVIAHDDLTGKPGSFTFVRCSQCDLAYQNPRVHLAHIKSFYDDEYIAHRKKTDWGVLTPLYERAMNKHDRDKEKLVRRFVDLGADSNVLDVGCAVGTFLAHLKKVTGCNVSGVDFKDLKHAPTMRDVDFHCGLFYEQPLARDHFDLVTMWHFLEHDYDPMRSLAKARDIVKPDGRIVIEVPRLDSKTFSLYGDRWPGLQAPQHTVLFDKKALLSFVKRAGLEVVEYLPYGAFPAYFYIFTGALFHVLKGKGLDLDRWVAPYFVGNLALSALMLFEKQLNLAMQTVVCRRAPQ